MPKYEVTRSYLVSQVCTLDGEYLPDITVEEVTDD